MDISNSEFTVGNWFDTIKVTSVLKVFPTVGWMLVYCFGCITGLRLAVFYQIWAGARVAGVPLIESSPTAAEWASQSLLAGFVPVVLFASFLAIWGVVVRSIGQHVSPDRPDMDTSRIMFRQFAVFGAITLIASAMSWIACVL